MKSILKIGLILALAWQADGAAQTRPAQEVQSMPPDKAKLMLMQLMDPPMSLGAEFKLPEEAAFDLLKKVCESSHVELTRVNVEGIDEYQLIPSDDLKKLPVCETGGARIFVSSADNHGGILLAPNGQITNDMTISLLMIAETNKTILRHTGVAQVDEALTDKGESLVPEKQAEPDLNRYSPSIMPVSVKLKTAPPGSKLKSLKGKIWVVQEEKSEDWTIEVSTKSDKPSKPVADGLESLELNSSYPSISLTIRPKKTTIGLPKTLLSCELLADRVKAYDANNHRVELTIGYAQVTNLQLMYPSRAALQRNPMPKKVVIPIPTEIKAVEVPFEFHDLQLP